MPSDDLDLDPGTLFHCRRCGQCCKGYGGTYVTQDEIRAIAEFIGVDPVGFVSRYCTFSGGRPLLAQGDDGYCIFWDELCTIHPVKPRMCKAWPFIESLLTDDANWRIMAASCPGIHPEAPLEKVKAYVRRQMGGGMQH